MRVAILVSKDMMELLSLISVGKEFQMCAPSNMKLFFKLFVRGYGKQRVLSTSRSL